MGLTSIAKIESSSGHSPHQVDGHRLLVGVHQFTWTMDMGRCIDRLPTYASLSTINISNGAHIPFKVNAFCQFLIFGPTGTTCEGNAPWVKSPNYFDPVTFISLPCIIYFKAHYIALIYNIGTDLQEDYSARTKHWHSVQSTCTIAVPGLRYGVRTESTDCEFSTENNEIPAVLPYGGTRREKAKFKRGKKYNFVTI